MKKHIIFVLLLLIPLSLSAQLKLDKATLLKQASEHRKAAIGELYYAEDLCWYIPNLQEKEHLKAFIVGAIGSITAKGTITKVLATGLTLVGSLSTNMYDKFCEMRSHLIKAEYHLELANFYDALTINHNAVFNTKYASNQDQGTRIFLSAIDYLTLAILSAQCIEERAVRESIVIQLNELRSFCLNKMKVCCYEESQNLYENIDEIIAECGDETLREEIPNYIRMMVECLKDAEAAWQSA